MPIDPFWGSVAAGLFGVAGAEEPRRPQKLSPYQGLFAGEMLGTGEEALAGLRGLLGGGMQEGIEQQYGLMQELFAPQRQREMEELESRLFAQGRLGGTGGALETQGMREAWGQQDIASYLQAQQSAMERAGLLGQLGAGMFAQTAPYRGVQPPAGGSTLADILAEQEAAQGALTPSPMEDFIVGLFTDPVIEVVESGGYKLIIRV